MRTRIMINNQLEVTQIQAKINLKRKSLKNFFPTFSELRTQKRKW